MQKHGELVLDLLSFGLRTDEPQNVVVGVTDIAQPSVIRVVHVHAGDRLLDPAQAGDQLAVALALPVADPARNARVLRITPTRMTAGEGRYQFAFHELVEPVEVDVGQDRRDNAALWRA